MEITPKNQYTNPAADSLIRNKLRKLPNSITPEENSQKTFIKLNIKTVEQQCDVKVKDIKILVDFLCGKLNLLNFTHLSGESPFTLVVHRLC